MLYAFSVRVGVEADNVNEALEMIDDQLNSTRRIAFGKPEILVNNQKDFTRDPDEPVAHIERALDDQFTCEGAEPFADGIQIIGSIVSRLLYERKFQGAGGIEGEALFALRMLDAVVEIVQDEHNINPQE